MVRCQLSSFLVLALVGLFAGSTSSLDVPRSFVRRAGDDNTEMLQKMIQVSEFNAHGKNAKRTLQVATKPTKNVTKPSTTDATTTEDQVAGPIITDILVQIVEIVIVTLAEYVIEIIAGIISGDTTAQGTVGAGLTALNTTGVTDALSELTKNLANITTDATNTTTGDQIAGPLITDILVQIVEAIILTLAAFLVEIIAGIISGEESATTVNEVLADISKSITNITAGATTTEDQVAGPVITDILVQIVEVIVVALTDALLEAILGIITGDSRRRNLETTKHRSLANITSTTEDQIAGPIITDILSQIVEVIIVAISDAIVDLIIGILTGESVASDSITGDMIGAVNTTALTTAVTMNVTVSINELTSSNKTLTEDQFIEAILPEVVELIVTALSDALINTVDESFDSEVLVDLVTSVVNATTDPLIAFLIDDLLGIVVAEESTFGSLNTTALDIAVDALGSDLAAASNSGAVSADTIESILAEALPAIIEAVILIFAQAIANAINDAIFELGLFANSERRQLASFTSHSRSLANVTSATEDQVAGPVITDILVQIVEIIVIALTDALLEAIISIITGDSRRRNLETTKHRSLANITSTTEDQIAGPIITDILSQIVEVIIVAISDAIVDLIIGILTGESVASDSITGDMIGAVNTTALTTAVTMNVTVSINELTSSNKTLTEDQFIEAILPEVVELIVTALSDALINTVDESFDSEVLVDLVTSVVNATTDPLIAFLIDDLLGIVVAEESTFGSLNTTALDIAVDALGSDLAAASNSGAVSADTIESILAEALPAIIEAVILIFAQAIANAINDVIFGLSVFLPLNRRRNLQASNSTDVAEDQAILTTILTLIINALVSALITVIIEAIFGSGATAESVLSNLQSTLSNITIDSIDQDAVLDTVVNVAKDEPVKKLRGILGGL